MNYESPVFVSLVLYTIYTLLAAAVAVTVWSVTMGIRKQRNAKNHHGGIPARRIALLTGILLTGTMTMGWLTASVQPLTVNGKAYTNTFWLRTSDMLITTVIVLTAVLLLAALYGLITRRNRHV
jgi:hypothetical protein